ncbi:MAG: M4 family metallopeptidase [Mycobacteriales bacterium]
MRRSTALLSSCLLFGTAFAATGTATANPTPSAFDRGLTGVRAHAADARYSSDQTFAVRSVLTDRDGIEHVRMDRYFRGLPVLGGDLVVHSARGGAYRGVSTTLRVAPRVSTTPRVPAASAASLAVAASPALNRVPSVPKLAVFARTGAPQLAYAVLVTGMQRDGTPSERTVVLSAATGRVLDSYEGIETAAGSGKGFFNGTVALETTPISGGYSLKDPSRGNQYTLDMGNKQGGSGTLFTDADNIWGDGTLANRQTTGVDAQYGTAETWDYYKNVHGRNGIANDGKGAYNRVHYSRNYNNAYWSDSCFCMTYGDGDGTTYNPFDSLDVAGHEMSHGVTSRTANLTYSGESGGINESNSDIFGTMVEFYANNPNDAPDYLIGEKLRRDGSKPLRWMDQPSKDGASKDCWYSGVGSLDVHYSSGVGNHFYYLLAVGSGTTGYGTSPTCNNSTVTGIGNAAAEKIWYRALTVYMTSSTNYAGARTATLNAARDLYLTGSTQYNAVAAAWSAVSVN